MKYERLTKKGSNYTTCDGEHDIIVRLSEDGSEEPIYDFDSICVKLNRLVELEDKIKSEKMLELPCKVGDTVYRAWYAPCRYGETYPDSYSCDGCEGDCDIKPAIFEEKANSLAYILENMVLGRNYVYATKEEAEARLKEFQDK